MNTQLELVGDDLMKCGPRSAAPSSEFNSQRARSQRRNKGSLVSDRSAPVGLAVIGAGYWGPNLVRNALRCVNVDLRLVCDLNVESAQKAVGRQSNVAVTTDVQQILDDPDIEALRSRPRRDPRRGRARLPRGRQARAGREAAGPVGRRGREARRRRAEHGLLVMCDHTYCYTPAVQIRELVSRASSATSSTSTRSASTWAWCSPTSTCCGTSRRTTSRSSTSSCPGASRRVGARRRPDRARQAVRRVPDPAAQRRRIAHVHVNWLSPTKIRTTIIGGSRRMVVWDDLNPPSGSASTTGASTSPSDRARERRKAHLVPRRRHGGARAARGEALRASWSSSPPRSASAARRSPTGRGLRVLEILEAASASAAAQGTSVPLTRTGAMIMRGRVLITGGAGLVGSTIADLLVETASRRSWSSTTSPRAAGQPRRRSSTARSVREGDVRDRDSSRPWTGSTSCSTRPRSASPSAPRSPARLRGAGRRHVQRRRGRGDAGVGKVVAASSASVYGQAESFPTAEDHHPYDNHTLYGAAKVFNEGVLRSFHDMYGLDYVALRYFNVYGPRMDIHGVYTEVLVRWMERIAAGEPPLILGDGSQTMDFVYIDDIARANLLAAKRRHRRRLQRRDRHRDQPERARRRAARGHGLRPRAGVQAGAKVNPVSAPSGRHHRARDLLGFEAQVDSKKAGRLVDWWRVERDRRPDHVLRRRAVIPVMRPWLGPEEAEAAAAAVAVGLGRPGPAGRRVRGGARRQVGARHGVAVSSCTAGLHLALVLPASAPATRSSCPRCRSSPPPTRCATSARRPVFADVEISTQNLTPETIEPC